MKLYVASSWRNAIQPEIVHILREEGYEVYDFRNPTADDHGFHWSEIDPEWRQWSPCQFAAALSHPIAERGFRTDADALAWADACVLVLPCGRSAHLEAGWCAGAGKSVLVLLSDDEPELMYKLADSVHTGPLSLLRRLSELSEIGTPDQRVTFPPEVSLP